MFKYAYDAALIDMPARYGPGFNKPSVVQVRKARARAELTNGKRLFEPPELRLMLETPTQPLRAMILLGINGGLGNADCARLPIAAVNF